MSIKLLVNTWMARFDDAFGKIRTSIGFYRDSLLLSIYSYYSFLIVSYISSSYNEDRDS